jgi:hypothetical protein
VSKKDTPAENSERKVAMAKQKEWAELSPEKQEEIKVAHKKKLTEASSRLTSRVEALLKENRWKEYLQFSLKFHQIPFLTPC